MKFHHFGDKGGVFTMKKVKSWSSHIVIARRTEWTTRQSIVSRGTRAGCLFVYCRPVDRHGLSALAMTKLELGYDQRFIPLHLFHSSPFNLLPSISWLPVDRHGLRPRDCICYGRHRSLFIKVNLKNRHIVDRPVNLH